MTASVATEEIDYTPYATKAPTDLQARMPDWITDKTGYDPNAAKSKAEAFREGVRLAVALRMPFQASPENRADTEARRAQRAAEASRPVQEEAPAPAPRGRKAAKAAAPAPAPAAPAKRAGRQPRKAQGTGAPF